MILKKLGLAAAVMLAGAQTAQANDLQINGFLNVTAGVIDNEAIENTFTNPGYDTTLGFDQQTLAGLQISKKVNDDTSATLQLMSRGSQGYDAEAIWAYITYDLSDNTAIRFGRLRTPFFQYSDFLDVGYAYNWITPPGIVYRLDSMSSMTGVDLTHQFTLGAFDGSFQIYTGRFDDEFELRHETYDMELRSTAGAVLNLNAGDFGARISYHQAGLHINDLGTFDPSKPFDPNDSDTHPDQDADGRGLDSLADLAWTSGLGDQSPSGETSSFYQGSLFWDNGSTSLMGEYTALRHDSNILNDDNAWMVTAAQRMGDFTVHLTYALAEDSLKSGTIGTAQKFAEAEETSATLGLRYDYSSSVAFKTEAHYITSKRADSRVEALEDGEDPITSSGKALEKNTGSMYTIGMSIVF